MLYTKACPRCEGDITRVDDIGDTYFSCVQCGHTLYKAPALVAVHAAEPSRTWLRATDRSVARKRRINRTPVRSARAA